MTPNDILRRFASHLNGKAPEVEFLVLSNTQIEKWLQGEFVLTFRSDMQTAIYDNRYNEIRDQYREQICDIAFEYKVFDQTDRLRLSADVAMVENPFLSNYSSSQTWIINTSISASDLRRQYGQQKNYYIELKYRWHEINRDNPSQIIGTMIDDINRYQPFDEMREEYKAKAIISICFVSFHSSNNDRFCRLDENDRDEQIKTELRRIDNLSLQSFEFSCEKVMDSAYLLMLVFPLSQSSTQPTSPPINSVQTNNAPRRRSDLPRRITEEIVLDAASNPELNEGKNAVITRQRRVSYPDRKRGDSHFVGIVTPDGIVEERYRMKDWLRNHDQFLPRGMSKADIGRLTSHQIRDILIRNSWTVAYEDDLTILYPPDSNGNK